MLEITIRSESATEKRVKRVKLSKRTFPLVISVAWFLGTAAAQDPRPTMTVGTATAKRGEVAYGELHVPKGSDAGTTISVAVIHGAKPGKVVAFVAGSHGTEYASIVALTRLIAQINPKQLTGSVIVAPLLNVPSFEQMTPHLNPVDQKGMNGAYPGNSNGTQTERALAFVTDQIVTPADVIVDLHGGDLDENLRPYSYWTRTGNTAQDEASHALVLALGLDHIILRDVDATNPASARSLSGYALAKGKTAIVAEAGRSGLVLDADVNALIAGSLNVLGSLKMIDRAVKPVASPVWVTGGSRVGADKPGMFFATVDRDTIVKEGATIGYTTDYLGRRTGEVRAPVAGLITFIRGVPSMWPGATLANVSPILITVPPYKKPLP
jgi:predicted deacylase